MSDKLIDDLTNDLKPCCPSCPYGTSAKLVILALAIGAGLLVAVGLRDDLPAALGTFIPYWKSGMFALIGVGALLTVCRLGLPGRGVGCTGPAFMATGLTGLLAFMAGMMLAAPDAHHTVPYEGSGFCLVTCLTLALAIFAGGALILRRLAFMRPRLAGWLLGTASGALVATAYAWHCDHDQPLYVALWYGLPVVVMGLFGALVGRRVFKM